MKNRAPAKLRIYFGGKIQKNDWRTEFSGGENSLYDSVPRPPWPEVPTSLRVDRGGFVQYTYTGPFFQSCDHGCYHGDNTHGVGLISEERAYVSGGEEEPWAGCMGEMYARDDVRYRCLSAIERSDIMFIWLDSLSA